MYTTTLNLHHDLYADGNYVHDDDGGGDGNEDDDDNVDG